MLLKSLQPSGCGRVGCCGLECALVLGVFSRHRRSVAHYVVTPFIFPQSVNWRCEKKRLAASGSTCGRASNQ